MAETLINQTAKIVLKFKDDFLLNADTAETWGIDMHIISNQYTLFSNKLIQKKNLTIANYSDLNPINFILSKLRNFNNVSLRYMFDDHPISVFNDLIFGEQLDEEVNPQDLKELPNFYNFFIVHLVPNDCGKDFKEMMDIISDLIYELEFKITLSDDNPLEYLYTTGIPVTTEGGGAVSLLPVMLIPHMKIPNSVLNANKPMTLFDLEIAWKTDSSELNTIIKNKIPFHPPNYISTIRRLSTPTSGVIPSTTTNNKIFISDSGIHGRKVLKLLKSIDNDLMIDGLLNDFIDIKLSSIFASDDTSNTPILKEESALLACLYTHNLGNIVPTESGNVILIEIATPPFPLEIQPAIFCLIKLATIRRLIVIEGAGNSGTDLRNMSIGLRDSPYRPEVASLMTATKFRDYYDNLVNEFNTTLGTTLGTLPSILIGANNWHNSTSGAIIVGAYNLDCHRHPQKDSNSNYYKGNEESSKVKIFAYGGGISLDESFRDTSAASALIAVMVVAIQSHKKDLGHLKLDARQMLDLLIASGTELEFNINTRESPTFLTIGIIPNWNNITF